MIVKLVGVHPQGLNKIHDWIDEVNNAPEFRVSEKKVKLISSELKLAFGNYVIEIQVPFQTASFEYARGLNVGDVYIRELFKALEIFPPSKENSVAVTDDHHPI